MLHNEDKELRAMLSPFEVTPPSYLAQRIVANATALPQRRGLFGMFTQAMDQWNYALAYKGMALACFMLLGIITAQQQTQLSASTSMDMSNLAMAEGWMEE